MADINKRTFDGFRIAITDPNYFVGRSDLVAKLNHSPFEVHILLGGNRLGKTSTLRAIEWTLLSSESPTASRAFPVYINLHKDQPKDSDNFRYILISRLRESLVKWQRAPWEGIRKTYLKFLSEIVEADANLGFLKVKVLNPTHARQFDQKYFEEELKHAISDVDRHGFNGICFLLDEAEFIVRSNWGNDACSYFRALKDSDAAIDPFLGLLFSGYRGVKEYQQRVGSPLYNIASVMWLECLSELDVKKLIEIRTSDEETELSAQETDFIWRYGGGHPDLTQQTINLLLDVRKAKKPFSESDLILQLLHKHNHDFSKWWNLDGSNPDGFSIVDRKVYLELTSSGEGTFETLSKSSGLPPLRVLDSLQVLAGTGVIRCLNDLTYSISSQLFEKWVIDRAYVPEEDVDRN